MFGYLDILLVLDVNKKHMAINIITGLPGSAKSYMCAQKIVELVKRNMSWYKISGAKRIVRSNLDMSDEFKFFAGEFFELWNDPDELPAMNDCDVIWEEMGAHVDSRSWEALPLNLRRWLQQHRHRGVEIYGNCQDFADIDVAVRRLTSNLLYLTKIIGSRDPSPTSKPVKYVWGVILKINLDPRTYKEDTKLKDGQFGGVEFVTKKGVELYSMRNDIKPGKYPALQHRSRKCADCGYVKVIHI